MWPLEKPGPCLPALNTPPPAYHSHVFPLCASSPVFVTTISRGVIPRSVSSKEQKWRGSSCVKFLTMTSRVSHFTACQTRAILLHSTQWVSRLLHFYSFCFFVSCGFSFFLSLSYIASISVKGRKCRSGILGASTCIKMAFDAKWRSFKRSSRACTLFRYVVVMRCLETSKRLYFNI